VGLSRPHQYQLSCPPSSLSPLPKPPAPLLFPRGMCSALVPECAEREAVCSTMWAQSTDNMESAGRRTLQGLAGRAEVVLMEAGPDV
jgi:hypothetical protein